MKFCSLKGGPKFYMLRLMCCHNRERSISYWPCARVGSRILMLKLRNANMSTKLAARKYHSHIRRIYHTQSVASPHYLSV